MRMFGPKILSAALLGAVVLLGAGCADDNDTISTITPGRAQIRAEVTVQGVAVPGVTVTLTDGIQASQVTNAQGVAIFTDVPDGVHFLTVSGFDPNQFIFNPAPTPVTIDAANRQVIVQFQGLPASTQPIAPGAAQIRAEVTVQGVAVPGVTVTLTDGVQASQVTDAQGVAVFNNVPDGVHQLTVSGWDPNRFIFNPAPTPVTINDANRLVIVQIQGIPTPNAVLTGRLTIGGLSPASIPGLPTTLTLTPPTGDPIVLNMAGSTGDFTFQQLPAGVYTLTINHAGQVRATTFTLQQGEQRTLNIEFNNLPTA